MYKLPGGDEELYNKYITHLSKDSILNGEEVDDLVTRRDFKLKMTVAGSNVDPSDLGGLSFEMDIGVEDWPIGQVVYKKMDFTVANDSAKIEGGMTTGQVVKPVIQLRVNDGQSDKGRLVDVPYGTYIVDSVAKDMTVKNYSCYDQMYYINDIDCDFGGETYPTTVGHVLSTITGKYADKGLIPLSDSHQGDWAPWWNDVLGQPKKYKDYEAPPEEEEEDELIIDDIPPIEETFPEDCGQEPEINPGRCCDCEPKEGSTGDPNTQIDENNIKLETFQFFPFAEITENSSGAKWRTTDRDIIDIDENTGVAFAYGLGDATISCVQGEEEIASYDIEVIKTTTRMIMLSNNFTILQTNGYNNEGIKRIYCDAGYGSWKRPEINGVIGGHLFGDREIEHEMYLLIPSVSNLSLMMIGRGGLAQFKTTFRVNPSVAIQFVDSGLCTTNIKGSANPFDFTVNNASLGTGLQKYWEVDTKVSIVGVNRNSVKPISFDSQYIEKVVMENEQTVDGTVRVAHIYGIRGVKGTTKIKFSDGSTTKELTVNLVNDTSGKGEQANYYSSADESQQDFRDLIKSTYNGNRSKAVNYSLDETAYPAICSLSINDEEIEFCEEDNSISLMNSSRTLLPPKYNNDGDLIAVYAEEPNPDDPTQKPNEDGQVLVDTPEEIGFEMKEGQMLGYIAAYCGGNIMLDHTGEVRLLRLVESEKESETLYDKHIPNSQVAIPEIDNCEASSQLGGLIVHTSTYKGDDLKYGNEKPTQTKYVIEIDNPFMTQERASAVYNEMSSLIYYPMRVVILSDPRLWLGDLLYFDGFSQLNEASGVTVEVIREGYYPIMKLSSHYDGAPSLQIEASSSNYSDRTNSFTGTLNDKIDEVSAKTEENSKDIRETKFQLEEIRALVGYINELFAIEVSADNIVSGTISTKNIRIAPTRKGAEGGIYIDGDSIDFLDENGIQRLHLGTKDGNYDDYFIRFQNQNGYTRELRALDPGPDCCGPGGGTTPEEPEDLPPLIEDPTGGGGTEPEEDEVIEVPVENDKVEIPQMYAVPISAFWADHDKLERFTCFVNSTAVPPIAEVHKYEMLGEVTGYEAENYVTAYLPGTCTLSLIAHDKETQETRRKTIELTITEGEKLIARPRCSHSKMKFKRVPQNILSGSVLAEASYPYITTPPDIGFYFEKPKTLLYNGRKARHLIYNHSNAYDLVQEVDHKREDFGFNSSQGLSLALEIRDMKSDNNRVLQSKFVYDSASNKKVYMANKDNLEFMGNAGSANLTVTWRMVLKSSTLPTAYTFFTEFSIPYNVEYVETEYCSVSALQEKMTVCSGGVFTLGQQTMFSTWCGYWGCGERTFTGITPIKCSTINPENSNDTNLKSFLKSFIEPFGSVYDELNDFGNIHPDLRGIVDIYCDENYHSYLMGNNSGNMQIKYSFTNNDEPELKNHPLGRFDSQVDVTVLDKNSYPKYELTFKLNDNIVYD